MSNDMTKMDSTAKNLEETFQADPYSDANWPAAAARGKTVPRPLIGFEEADDYSLPTEMYAKLLVNSPIEFGTVGALVANEDDPTGCSSVGFDIDVAVHPHHGALVCEAVYASAGSDLVYELNSAIKAAREDQEVLHDILADTYDLDDYPIPLGIFITLVSAERADLPADVDRRGVWFCSESEINTMPARMIEAMDQACAATEGCDEEPFFGYGARFMATVRGLRRPGEVSYTSALESLLTYDCI